MLGFVHCLLTRGQKLTVMYKVAKVTGAKSVYVIFPPQVVVDVNT